MHSECSKPCIVVEEADKPTTEAKVNEKVNEEVDRPTTTDKVNIEEVNRSTTAAKVNIENLETIQGKIAKTSPTPPNRVYSPAWYRNVTDKEIVI